MNLTQLNNQLEREYKKEESEIEEQYTNIASRQVLNELGIEVI